MSVFDEILSDRADAIKEVKDHTTRVPSFPAQVRARWKPLDDPTSVAVLLAAAEGDPETLAPQMVRILSQSLVQFEATDVAEDDQDDDTVWEPVLGPGGPLGFDHHMASKLRLRGLDVGEGAVAVAIAVCGGPGGLISLAGDVGTWQLEVGEKIAAATGGSFAARQKTLATAPHSAS